MVVKVFMAKRLLLLLAALAGFLCWADEGMWPVNQFPKEAVKKRYGFDVTDGFLDHIQRSSVRFNNGGSGSIISFNLKIKKSVAGVNPISAKCTDGKLKVHVEAKFEDGTKAQTEIVRACTPKG